MAAINVYIELHHILFEIHVIEGSLVCPETGKNETISIFTNLN